MALLVRASSVFSVAPLRRCSPLALRQMSTAPAPARASDTAAPALRSSTLPGGLRVVSLASRWPLAHVAVAVRAGARHEVAGPAGAVAHSLRVGAGGGGLSSARASSFLVTVRLQQAGAALHCSGDRESLVFSTAVLRHPRLLDDAIHLLGGVATQPTLDDWEVEALLPRVALDTQRCPALAALLDDLHRAAYRATPLGRPLYAQPGHIHALDSTALRDHVQRCVTPANTAVVGVGIDHDQLCEFAAGLSLAEAAGGSTAAAAASQQRHKLPLKLDSSSQQQQQKQLQQLQQPVLGGEVRCDHSGDTALVAVAGNGVAAASAAAGDGCSTDLAAQLVLECLLGSEAPLKYSSRSCSGLLADVAAEFGASVRGLGATYSDAALSGFCVAAPAAQAGAAVRALYAALRTAPLAGQQLQLGQQLARARVLHECASGAQQLQQLVQLVMSGAAAVAPPTEAMLGAIDSVTVQHLEAARKRLLSGKLAMAARGNLTTLPYLDEL